MKVFETRKVDELGRVVLPLELRKAHNIDVGATIDICVNDNDQIVLVRSEPHCKICGVTEDLKEIKNNKKFICPACIGEISNL